jgi:predicted metal-dependent hydrolase
LSKAAWIAAHRMASPGVLQHGQAIGKAHHLSFERSVDAARVSTKLRNNQVHVTHPLHLPADDITVQDAARSASIRALRKEAEQLLPYRLRQLAERDGFTYRSVGVKQLKSRWGSCSSDKDIILNLYLMQLPWHLIDYVLFHELTHTKVMQHGPPFWRELEYHVTHAKLLRKEIGNYHPILTAPPAAVA